MKKLTSKLSAIAATSAALSLAISVNAPHANAALKTYDLSWNGSNGYSAMGMFSFDDSLLGQIITKNELDSLSLNFFDPNNTLLQSFFYPNPASDSDFNFNFNSATGQVIQSGAYDNPVTGLDLGINYEAGEVGLDFYTSNGDTEFGQPAPIGTLVLENNLTPQGCATFPSPDCERLSIGGTLVATAVPEPASVVGLLFLAGIGAGSTLKKKFGSVQAGKSRSFVS